MGDSRLDIIAVAIWEQFGGGWLFPGPYHYRAAENVLAKLGEPELSAEEAEALVHHIVEGKPDHPAYAAAFKKLSQQAALSASRRTTEAKDGV
jgi:hypothetical protein